MDFIFAMSFSLLQYFWLKTLQKRFIFLQICAGQVVFRKNHAFFACGIYCKGRGCAR